VVPKPAAPSPLRAQPPQWVEPAAAQDVQHWRQRVRGIPIIAGIGLFVGIWMSVLSLSWGLAWWPLVGGGVLAAVLGWSVVAGLCYDAARHRDQQRRAQAWAHFERASTEWRSRVAEHDRREQTRIASVALWHPVQPEPGSRHVNVFGGSADGWSSLLATQGLSILFEGCGLLVLDFTEQRVAEDLAMLADAVGYPTHHDRLPADGIPGVADLSPSELGEIFAEALTSLLGPQPDSARSRAVYADLVERVAACLCPPRTFERIADGLAVLRRTFDAEAENSLSAEEIRRVNRLTETMGSPAALDEQSRFLAGSLRLLGEVEGGQIDPLWPGKGLRVVTTTEINTRRKALVDRWVFFRLLHAIRTTPHRGTAVVVAGADHLGAAGLEALTRHGAHLRLIVMFEHLRGEPAQVLGGAGSATVLMRLGHAAEATAAADFVGRGYRFVLSQLTEQIGRSFTDGLSDTTGDSVTTSTSESYSPASSGTSDSRSRALTWSKTSSWSWSESLSGGQTWSRAYEYTVEPTTFQSLPVTAFILVETGARGRRVVAGDCNPGIALLDRVAPDPGASPAAITC
jgi:hypothetical protein